MRTFNGYKNGINLGGWLSQCGASNYTKEHYDSFITENDIDVIASWGIDHIRLPVDYNIIENEDGSFIEDGFKYIDSCIEWCAKRNLHMVLDLHKTFGYVFDDKNYCQFFYNTSMQDIFVNLWKELTIRYGKYSDFVAFELLNEITDPSTAEIWNNIADRTIKEIRTLNKEVKIIIGGIYNSSIDGLLMLDKPADENIVFTFHCYSPMIFTHQSAYWVENMTDDMNVIYPAKLSDLFEQSHSFFGSDYDNEFANCGDTTADSSFFVKLFEKAIAVGEKYNVPLYCGEYGVIDRADSKSTINWYCDITKAFDKFDISRAAWTYKGKDFGIIDDTQRIEFFRRAI